MKKFWFMDEKPDFSKVEVVFLFHRIPNNIMAFDILIRNDMKEKKPRLYKWLKKRTIESDLNEKGYKVRWSIVKLFLKKHKNFEYVFSSDFDRIYYINVYMLHVLLQISQKFKVEVISYDSFMI